MTSHPMTPRTALRTVLVPVLLLPLAIAVAATASAAEGGFGRGGPGGRGRGGPGGFPGGPMGGPMGGMNQRRLIVEKYDADSNGRLDAAERAEARKDVQKGAPGFGRGPGGRRPGGRGGPGGPFGGAEGGESEAPREAERLSPEQVPWYPDRPLFDPAVLRTIFLEFPDDDWEAELADFKGTDVEVPADMIVDGKTYPSVGVRFQGNTSYMSVPAGKKRSLNVSIDHVLAGQRLLGQRTLNLLNSHEDPTFLHAVLYHRVAGEFIPAPRANLVKVVINGESWGVYSNVEQFNKDFLRDRLGAEGGVRWKVPQDPSGSASLLYRGDDVAPYRRSYELKAADDEDAAWKSLIDLCRALDRTPAAEVEDELARILDIDEALWFIALEAVLTDGDGYLSRGSDFLIHFDASGRSRMLPYDSNETFGAGMMGPPGGGPGGPGGGFGGGPGGFPGGFPGGPGGFPGGFGDFQGFGGFPGELDELRGFGDFPDFEDVPGDPAFGPGPPGTDDPLPAPPSEAAERRSQDIPPSEAAPTNEREKPGPAPRAEPGDDAGRREPAGREGAGTRDGLGEPRMRRFPGPERGPGGGRADPLAHADSSSRPLVRALLAVPSLRARYLAHVRTLAGTWLDWRTLGPIVAEYRAVLGDEVAKDTKKLYALARYDRGVSDDAAPPAGGGADGGRGGRESLRAFAEERRKALLSHEALQGPFPSVLSVRLVQAGCEPATVAAEVGPEPLPSAVLLYHAVGSAPFRRTPMLDDGVAPDEEAGDRIHTAVLPAFPAGTVVRYYVEARGPAGTLATTFHPEAAERGAKEHRVRPRTRDGFPVRINEVLSSVPGAADGKPERTSAKNGKKPSGGSSETLAADWIELHNASDAAVDLSGLWLSDDPDRPRQWSFPAGATIGPRGFLVVLADGTGGAGAGSGLHASFDLAREGEAVWLLDRDDRGNDVLDRAVFGKAKEGDSAGRVPDGAGELRPTAPTPGAPNATR